LALLLAILNPLSATAQIGEGFHDVALRHVPVAGNVHMIQRVDGFANVGVFVGEEGVLLVDSQFEPHADDMVSEVRKISDGEIRFLVNTHVHPDHIGGNAPLAGTIEALDLAIGLAGPNTKVIPGYGIDVVRRKELVQFRDMIVDVSERVRELIAQATFRLWPILLKNWLLKP
jgi:glyoxylase-like metal-dependent hydrolase (beta-lactamase superfamily II)